MKKNILFLSIMFFSFSQTTNEDFETYLKKTYLKFDVKQLSSDSLFKYKNAILIDIREKNEYDVSHIKNSVFTSFDHFNIDDWSHIRKDRPLILYCSVGYRSCKIAEQFIKVGYKNVFNLYGGIFRWINQKKEIINSEKIRTSEVHTYNKRWGRYLLNKQVQKVHN